MKRRRFLGYVHRGFSLIEAAIVLGVVGLVLGGTWIGASAVNTRMKVQAYVTLLTQAMNAGRDYQEQCRGAICSLSSLIDATKLPPGIVKIGSQFGGPGLVAEFSLSLGTFMAGFYFIKDAASGDYTLITNPMFCTELSKALMLQKQSQNVADAPNLWWSDTSWGAIEDWSATGGTAKPTISQVTTFCQTAGLFGANGILP